MKNAKRITGFAITVLLLVWLFSGQVLAQSWQLPCASGTRVEVIAVGMGTEAGSVNPVFITIPHPEEVDSILVQAVLKVPPEIEPPSEVEFATAVGGASLGDPDFITQGYGYHYEEVLEPAGSIRVKVVGTGTGDYNTPRAAVAYVFRKAAAGEFGTGKLVHQGLWWKAKDRPSSFSETFAIPAAMAPRDVRVTFVVTDKDSEPGRTAKLRAQAGALVVEQTFDAANCGDEALVQSLILKNVPGEITSVTATVSSPDEEGDSIFWSGVHVSSSCEIEMDMGDAPEPGFPTLLSHNGARHLYRPGYMLGASLDTESDGHPEEKANGDDFDGIDDEDGVTFKSKLVQGGTAQIEVSASAAGFLSAWIDWDGDGAWNPAGEQVLIDVALTAGINPVSFLVPHTGLGEVQSICRFRFSSKTGLHADGPAPDGEVEDYMVPVFTPVELSSFTAAAIEEGVVLQWQTQSESENLGFYVFRATAEEGLYTQITTELIAGAGSSSSAHQYRYVDRTGEPGQVYYYQIVDISSQGMKQWHGPVKVELIKPKVSRLDQNMPNPFNAQTRISYSLKQAGEVALAVYNLQGQRVRTLVSTRLAAGSYSAIWDGRDDAGQDLPSGTYAYILKLPDSELSQRMTLLK